MCASASIIDSVLVQPGGSVHPRWLGEREALSCSVLYVYLGDLRERGKTATAYRVPSDAGNGLTEGREGF